jgi:hypothetical protein
MGMKKEKVESTGSEFQHLAERPQPNVVREMFAHLRHSKKWWLGPIIIGLLIAAVIVVLSGTAVAPLIYTLF